MAHAARNDGREAGCPAHAAGRNATAGLRPERVRRDKSRLYVTDFACGRERVMISCGGGFPRAGRWCTGSEAADPIGVAPSITAGERSHPRTGTTHHSDPMGVELHTDVVRTAGCRPTGVGFSAASIRRAAASLLRGCACGLPAVVGSWTPMGSFFFCCSCPRVRLWLTRGYRKFAPYGGACLTVPPLTARIAQAAGRNVGAGLRPEQLDARMASLL